jgi:hypothetical protein
MDRTALRPLFDWGRCQSCMMVTEGWDAMAPPPNRCPSCGEPGFGLDWPPEPSRLLLRQAFLREAEDQEEFAVHAFLVAAALDVALEWILAAAIEYLSTESLDIARLIEPVREAGLSTEQRLDLLEEVADIRLRPVADLREESDFPGRWRDLRERRDHFLHDQEMFAFDGLTQLDLAETARMGVKILAHVNNIIW